MRIKQVPPLHRSLLRRVSATACGPSPNRAIPGTVGVVGLLVWEGSPLRGLWPKLQATLAANSFDLTRIDLASPAISTVTFGLLLFALLLLLRPVLTED